MNDPKRPQRVLMDAYYFYVLSVFAKALAHLVPRSRLEPVLTEALLGIGDNEELSQDERMRIWRLCQKVLDSVYPT